MLPQAPPSWARYLIVQFSALQDVHIGLYALEIAIAITIIKPRYFPYDINPHIGLQYGCDY